MNNVALEQFNNQIRERRLRPVDKSEILNSNFDLLGNSEYSILLPCSALVDISDEVLFTLSNTIKDTFLNTAIRNSLSIPEDDQSFELTNQNFLKQQQNRLNVLGNMRQGVIDQSFIFIMAIQEVIRNKGFIRLSPQLFVQDPHPSFTALEKVTYQLSIDFPTEFDYKVLDDYLDERSPSIKEARAIGRIGITKPPNAFRNRFLTKVTEFTNGSREH